MKMNLMVILFPMIATVMVGMIITGNLIAGMGSGSSILISAGVGVVISFPVTWAVARAMVGKTGR